MDAVRLPNLGLPTAMLAGQRRRSPSDVDDGIVPGKTIVVTSTSDSVGIKINDVTKTYAVTPNVPTKIVVEEDDITQASSIFDGQKNVIEIDFSDFDSSNITTYSRAFFECSKLKSVIGLKVTSKATSLNDMFYQCNKLEEIDSMSTWDTSNVSGFWRMFYGCGNCAKDFSNFNISRVTNIQSMFANGGTGSSVDISSFDFSNIKSTTSMFDRCGKLTDLQFGYNLKVSLDLKSCPLTHESALSVIDGLAEVDTPQTVTFKSTTYNTLTEEEIALATSKGWNVASA